MTVSEMLVHVISKQSLTLRVTVPQNVKSSVLIPKTNLTLSILKLKNYIFNEIKYQNKIPGCETDF